MCEPLYVPIDQVGYRRVPTDEAGQRHGQVGASVAGVGESDIEVGILHQDGPLDGGKLAARGQAEVLEQPHA